MNDNQKPKQVSLAGAAAGKRETKTTTQKKRIRLIIIAVVLVVALLVALFVRGCDEQGPSLTARETVQYTVTPDDIAGKVSYFALGVLGDKSTDRLDMVAVMCYDRKADKITVLQLPVATYLGEDGAFAASVVGDVWGNPSPLTWCDTCRCKVTAADEISGDEHTVCGTKLTSRVGSSFTDLAAVFNKQYGLPIDNYLVVPRDGLAKLIDEVGGVDMNLDGDFTLDEVQYKKGVQTLSGKAAVYYAVEYNYNGTPDADRARLLRQRQLFASLLARLSEYKESELYNAAVKDVLSGVMLGADPIRYDTTSFGKARLMDISESRAENVKYIAALAAFIHDIGRVDMEDITYCTLPGVSVKRGTSTVYSVNKTQTLALLGQYMNPYGLALDDTTVTVPELKQNPPEVDAAITTLDQVLVKVSAQ